MHKLLILDYIECSKVLLGAPLYNFLSDYVFLGVQIAVPIVVIIYSMKDILIATAAGDEKQMKTAQLNVIKRIIVGVVIEFLPIIINTILAVVGLTSGRC